MTRDTHAFFTTHQPSLEDYGPACGDGARYADQCLRAGIDSVEEQMLETMFTHWFDDPGTRRLIRPAYSKRPDRLLLEVSVVRSHINTSLVKSFCGTINSRLSVYLTAD